MGGPVCATILSHSFSDGDRAQLAQMIATVGRESDGNDFWVQSTFAVGGAYRGEPRPFIVEVHGPGQMEVLLDLVDPGAFGCVPGCEILFAAMCNGGVDHRILAELSVWCARTWSGAIWLGGLVPLSPNALEAMPGRLRELTYHAGSHSAAVHLVDADFLEAWMRHPGFCMIK